MIKYLVYFNIIARISIDKYFTSRMPISKLFVSIANLIFYDVIVTRYIGVMLL